MWGEVHYTDSFGQRHYTRFRYVFGGDDVAFGTVSHWQDGNEAT